MPVKAGRLKAYRDSIITRSNVSGWYIEVGDFSDEEIKHINNLMEQFVSYEERWDFDVWTFWKRTYVTDEIAFGKERHRTYTTCYVKRGSWEKTWHGKLSVLLKRVQKYYLAKNWARR